MQHTKTFDQIQDDIEYDIISSYNKKKQQKEDEKTEKEEEKNKDKIQSYKKYL